MSLLRTHGQVLEKVQIADSDPVRLRIIQGDTEGWVHQLSRMALLELSNRAQPDTRQTPI